MKEWFMDSRRAVRVAWKLPGQWHLVVALGVSVLAAGAAGWAVGSGALSAASQRDRATAIVTDEAVRIVEAELARAQGHYARASHRLGQITGVESTALDPAIAAVLHYYLTVIDDAIDENREALNTQPANKVVQQSLFSALRSKVTLLQTIVALINEMRQDDQEGVARVLSGTKLT